eukprot:XP_011668535.1 PREDICTED: uncharacterized protein LOC105440269 [Strongylocentrotus purpuratus]
MLFCSVFFFLRKITRKTTREKKMNADTLELARKYDSVSSVYMQNGVRDKALSWIELEKDDVVLEVGCGSGRLCKILSPRVNSVTGLDISVGLIELAKRENPASNVQFFEEDAQTFGPHLHDWREKFDKILSFTVLQWCSDKESILKNVYRCLKPGGIFLLDFGLHGQCMGEWSSYGETADVWVRKHPKWGSYLQNCGYAIYYTKSSEGFLEIMRSVGFIIQRSEVKQRPWVKWNEETIKSQLRCLFYPITQSGDTPPVLSPHGTLYESLTLLGR